MNRSRQYYLLAILLGLLLHGTMLAFTINNTYDAYVHMFFGSHYAEGWFDTWNYKWYTGFTMTSYPPLVHHLIGLLSHVVGLKLGYMIVVLTSVALFIRGVYQFSRIWVSDIAAGYASLLAMLSSSYIEALHIFGQLPSLMGIGLLLNACPHLYRWVRYNQWSYFIAGLSIIACLTTAHHVTTIFGAVFFLAPVLGVAVLDICIEDKNGIENVRVIDYLKKVWVLSPKAILIGFSVIAIAVTFVFPYWYWTSTDPITQVSIPHGSRASFVDKPSLGLVFFLIPWGSMLLFFPGIIHKILRKRNSFIGLSFVLLFVLGTGGTTPIPKMILGENAYNILTLDRFTFWASIIGLPFYGMMIYSLVEGDLGNAIRFRFGKYIHNAFGIVLVSLLIGIGGFIINFVNFRNLQPDPIDIEPIVDFIERDNHDNWRFMTLGFGDQMAWLSANTTGLSVDGNYHSARRLPELTTRAVERIENSKYLGEEGLEALRDFLSDPGKYHLKYVFSNDKFYEPVLYFYGWSKITPLENNIDVWKRLDIPPLPSVLPKLEVPDVQRFMWGALPLTSLFLALMLNVGLWFSRSEDRIGLSAIIPAYASSRKWYLIHMMWGVMIIALLLSRMVKINMLGNYHSDPIELIQGYFHALDYKKFDKSYSYLDKSDGLTIEQYRLELSLEDGILASYSILDTVAIQLQEVVSPDHHKYRVVTHWFTALEKYKTEYLLETIRTGEEWYIKKPTVEKMTPPDQMINIPDVNYFNQGRRKAQAGKIFKEDFLDRPEVYVTEANLVKRQGKLYIVGELYNIDNVPCYIALNAKLLNNNDKIILSSHTNDVVIHNLLPKERTYFRIDFDNWIFAADGATVDSVASFSLFASSSVTDDKLYKFYGLRHLKVNGKNLTGGFDNFGNKAVSVPQIITCVRENNILKWVQADYLKKGIRPQREKKFDIDIKEHNGVLVKMIGKSENIFVNETQRDTSNNLLPSDWNTSDMYLKDGDVTYTLLVNGLMVD